MSKNKQIVCPYLFKILCIKDTNKREKELEKIYNEVKECQKKEI